jgi:galactonate dehydratase
VKIVSVSTVVVNAEMRNWVFVKLGTDEGLVGWGEATVEWKTRAVVGCIDDLSTLLVGEDPRRVEHMFQMMVRQHFFRPGMVEASAISGVEQAC